MRRLSSTFTVFYKRVFPSIGLLLPQLPLLSGWALWHASMHGRAALGWLSLLPSLVIFPLGLVIYRKLIVDLVDEVWLDGDGLVVKNRGRQARIELVDVINVNATVMINPRRVTLLLRADSPFGRSVTFMPADAGSVSGAFKPDAVAVELIGRIDVLRQARR